MTDKKCFRLWQVAQEFKSTSTAIVKILAQAGIQAENNHNLKITSKQYDIIANYMNSIIANNDDVVQDKMQENIPTQEQIKASNDVLLFDDITNSTKQSVTIQPQINDIIEDDNITNNDNDNQNTKLNIFGHIDLTQKIFQERRSVKYENKNAYNNTVKKEKKTTTNNDEYFQKQSSYKQQFSPKILTETEKEAYKARQQERLKKILSKKTVEEQRKNQAAYAKIKKEKVAERIIASHNSDDNRTLHISEFITTNVLAGLLHQKISAILKKCLDLGLNITINQRLDKDTIQIIAGEFDKNVVFDDVIITNDNDDKKDPRPLVHRPPIVTVVGHVDHGKTTLLDYIKKTSVVKNESGGITQHIGAYKIVTAEGKSLTFIDTPGHEAFTAMRARGCDVTDIIVVVIAADDSVQPQTVEALNQAKLSSKPIIFAINKVDKPTANDTKVKEDLAKLNFIVEDWGGKYQCQEISAKTGHGIIDLLEKIILEAEINDFKAHHDGPAKGIVLEAALDKGRGYANTLIIQDGELKNGDIVLTGSYYGKIKTMIDDKGTVVKSAHPSDPVKVFGINGAPHAGEKFFTVSDEKEAKDIAAQHERVIREQTIHARNRMTLQDLNERTNSEYNQINIIIKGDVDGSVQALADSLLKLSNPTVGITIIASGVGNILDSDIELASTTKSLIIGFNEKASSQGHKIAKEKHVEIKNYSIIYDAIDFIKERIKSFTKDKYEEKYVGRANVIQIFNISKVGTVAGCMITEGPIHITDTVKVIRKGEILYSGPINSLKHFKSDVKEVSSGLECGVNIKKYDNYKIDDILEFYTNVKI